MYEYTVFRMKEEISWHYFHKSDILYRFIKHYQKEYQQRPDLQVQYDYSTYPFPGEQFCNIVEEKLDPSMFSIENVDFLRLHKNSTNIPLHISEKHLKFRCKTILDAEEILFPILRQIDSTFFIIGENIAQYGWVSPVIRLREPNLGQVLYSYH
ncbi:sporulation inhibitor of replication protein SirA [Oceanobacillus kapialis]|uniref:Sporulation inhibitor of replication protein SirA n=1 Tax=Oceanobacillus kapialis TaxID=481353 RepID=A0ABW5PYY3_9BACI